MVRILYITAGSQAVPVWVLAIQESKMTSHFIWPHFQYYNTLFFFVRLIEYNGLMKIYPAFLVQSNKLKGNIQESKSIYQSRPANQIKFLPQQL